MTRERSLPSPTTPVLDRRAHSCTACPCVDSDEFLFFSDSTCAAALPTPDRPGHWRLWEARLASHSMGRMSLSTLMTLEHLSSVSRFASTASVCETPGLGHWLKARAAP